VKGAQKKENQKRLSKVFVLGFTSTEKVKEVLRQVLSFSSDMFWAPPQIEQVSEHTNANFKRIPETVLEATNQLV